MYSCNATTLIATIINLLVIAPDRERDVTHEIEYAWCREMGNEVVTGTARVKFRNYNSKVKGGNALLRQRQEKGGLVNALCQSKRSIFTISIPF